MPSRLASISDLHLPDRRDRHSSLAAVETVLTVTVSWDFIPVAIDAKIVVLILAVVTNEREHETSYIFTIPVQATLPTGSSSLLSLHTIRPLFL